MGLEDFMNDREADEELHKRSGPEKKKVTEEMHRQYVQDRLFEAAEKVSIITKATPNPRDILDYPAIKKYLDNITTKCMEVVRSLSVVPSNKDISNFCASDRLKDMKVTNSIGLFISFLINAYHKDESPIELDLRQAHHIHNFGYKLNKKVTVRGDLGDNLGILMQEDSNINVYGNCGQNVGIYQSNGLINVDGTVGYVGPVRFGGKIHHNGETQRPKRPSSQDLVKILGYHQHNLRLGRVYQEMHTGQQVYLDPHLREMLHPAFLETVCIYNDKVYQRREIELEKLAQNKNSEAIMKLDSADGKTVLRVGGSMILSYLIPISIPIVFYQIFKSDKIRDKAEQEVRIGTQEINALFDVHNREVIRNAEFYLSLPKVNDPELTARVTSQKAQMASWKAELAKR